TIKQTVAARALEIVLAASAARPSRRMRRIPRLGRRTVIESRPVGVSDHGYALTALGPVSACAVFAGGEGRSIRLRAGENVVHVRRIAAAVDDLALFGERSLLGEIVGGVQLGNVL